MIKKVITTFECRSCGNIINLVREIPIDEYLENIELNRPRICVCGNIKKSNFKLTDVVLQ